MFMAEPAGGLDFEEQATFLKLFEAVERCGAAGRFGHVDPEEAAIQLWSMEHGLLTLHLAGFLGDAQAFLSFHTVGGHLIVAFGDELVAMASSLVSARRRATPTAIGLAEAAGTAALTGCVRQPVEPNRLSRSVSQRVDATFESTCSCGQDPWIAHGVGQQGTALIRHKHVEGETSRFLTLFERTVLQLGPVDDDTA